MKPSEWPPELKDLIKRAAEAKLYQSIYAKTARIEQSLTQSFPVIEADDHAALGAHMSGNTLHALMKEIEKLCEENDINSAAVFIVVSKLYEELKNRHPQQPEIERN
jgi:hypothetical protein